MPTCLLQNVSFCGMCLINFLESCFCSFHSASLFVFLCYICCYTISKLPHYNTQMLSNLPVAGVEFSWQQSKRAVRLSASSTKYAKWSVCSASYAANWMRTIISHLGYKVGAERTLTALLNNNAEVSCDAILVVCHKWSQFSCSCCYCFYFHL